MKPVAATSIALSAGLMVILVAGAGRSVGFRGAQGTNPQAILDRAVADFEAGRLEASAAGFDRLAELVPGYAAQLWQRGIALYYVDRFDDCRAQFEAHRTVNPNDVENAVWHFLCVARGASADEARTALLPVGPDSRAPMTEIYEMFAGRRAPDDVLIAAGSQPRALFYAHLYVGLYHEALGNGRLAAENIAAAADERYASAGGYMHMVARVHRDWMRSRERVRDRERNGSLAPLGNRERAGDRH